MPTKILTSFSDSTSVHDITITASNDAGNAMGDEELYRQLDDFINRDDECTSDVDSEIQHGKELLARFEKQANVYRSCSDASAT